MQNTEGPSQRQLRVGEQLRHMIGETLRRGHFHDPLLVDAAQDVTVSEVRISPDLKNATAYVLTLGGEGMDEILPALNEAAPYFQKEFGRNLKLRFTPRIRFVKDDSFEKVSRIEKILQSLPEMKKEKQP